LWHRPNAFYNPQLWAEDGTIFFMGALTQHAPLINLPYAGYHHVLAHFVAYLGLVIPIRYAPHWYTFSAWLLLVALVTYIFSKRLGLPHWQRLLLSWALVGVPVNNEIYFNVANWAFIAELFWLLLAVMREPHTPRQALLDSAVLVLTGLNTPFAICLWPIFWLRWALRRTQHGWRLGLLSLIVAGLQIFNMGGRLSGGGEATWSLSPRFIDAVIYRFAAIFTGDSLFPDHLHLADATRLVSLLVIAVFFGVWFAYYTRRQHWVAWVWLWSGLMAGLLSMFVMRAAPDTMRVDAGRHFFLPALTLTWALIVSPTHWRWPFLLLMCSAFLFLTPRHKLEIRADLDWAGHLTACETPPRFFCLGIPIHPTAPPWFVSVPMSEEYFPTALPNHVYLPAVLRAPRP
jgi:hypothetical protein